MKKLVTAFLAILTLFALVSCSPGEEKAPEKVVLENVYLAEKIPTPDNVDLYNLMVSGDRAYFSGSKEVKTTDEYGNEISEWHECIYVSDQDFSDIKELYTYKGEWGYDEDTGVDWGNYLNGYNPAGDGNLWVSFVEYRNWREDDEYKYEENTTLKLLSPDGTFLKEVDISSILKEQEEFSDGRGNAYIGQVFTTSDGKMIMIIGSEYVFIIDKDLNPISLTKMPENKSPSDIAIIDNDTLRMTCWDWSGTETKTQVIDFTISKEEFNTVADIETYHSVQMGDDGTVYVNDYNVVSKYDFEKKELIPLLDWINSDINSDRLMQYYPAGNDEFYTFEYSMDYETRTLLHLTPAKDGDVVEKYVMTLAANGINSDLKSMIIDFNRSNEDYRIAVKAYGWEEKASEKFDLDLLSGNVPDIIAIDSSFNLTKYATKGILADIGEYLDSDKEVTRDTLLPNILKTAETNGKIYSLPVSFAVRSMMVKKSIAGDKTSFTFDDIKAILASYPKAVYMRETDREMLMDGFLPIILEDFIDYDNNKANFTDGKFAKFLEFAKNFPPKIDYETYYEEIDWEAYENDFKEGRVIANTTYISDFSTLEWQEEQFGEEVTLIGYPTDNGDPHAIVYDIQFAIGAQSRYKQQAWDFMKMLLEKEYQTEYVWTFPVNKEAFEEKKNEQIEYINKRFSSDDEYGDDYDYVIDDDMLVEPRAEIAVEDSLIMPRPEIVPEDNESREAEKQRRLAGIEKVYNIATTTTRLARMNDPVLDIISSDVGAYFDSKKSAEETSKTIESRVNLYLAENS